MRFTELELAGAFLVEVERLEDERGHFARTFCAEEFERRGLQTRIVQCNVSYNRLRGTLRGLHYQAPPHAEAKLIACTQGSICDVIVDLRPSSPTSGRWLAVTLQSGDGRSLYVPEGLAHGFQSLEDESVVAYQMFHAYHPESARGIRWDDPALGIEWPLRTTVISARDRSYPLLERPT